MPAQSATQNHNPTPIVWTPEFVQRYWDWMSHHSDAYFTEAYGDAIVGVLRPHLKGRQSVLDYGCGTGFLLQRLVDAGWTGVGADSSSDSLAAVRQKLDGHRRFGGAYSIDAVLERGERFDALTSIEVVEHLPDEVLDDTLARWKQLLKPSGVVAITTPNEEQLAAEELYCPSCDHTYHRWQHVRSWSADSLSAYLNKSGFDVIEARATDFAMLSEKSALRRWSRRRSYRRHPERKFPHLVVIARLRG